MTANTHSSPLGGFLTSVWGIPVAVLLLLAGSLTWFAYDERKQILEREFRYLESNVRIADAQISGLMRSVNQLLTKVARERQELPATQHAVFDAMLLKERERFPEIRSLVVVNAGGRVELTGNPNLKGFDSSPRDYFIAHRDRVLEPNFHASRPFKTSFGDQSIAFSVAIRDGNQKLLGVVVSGLSPKYFTEVVKQIVPDGSGSTATLFNREGEILNRQPDLDKFIGKSIASGTPFQEHMRSGQRITRHLGVSAVDGVERMIVFSRVGETTLMVNAARPVDEVFASWRVNVAIRIALFLLAASVILTLATVAQRRERARRVAEADLQRLNDELERRVHARTADLEAANKDLESFSYSVSHDLRAPLRAINGFATILLDEESARLSADGRKMLDRIVHGARKLGDLIDNVLEYSRVGRLALNEGDIALDALAQRIAGELRERYPSTEIRVEPLPCVHGDPTMLGQVLNNLLDNACKYSAKSARPLVEVGQLTGVDNSTVFFVRDNGAGFDMRYAEKLFGMFQRMHPEREFEGAGVGLAIVKRLIERHGGRVWAEAVPGSGATFYFTLARSCAGS